MDIYRKKSLASVLGEIKSGGLKKTLGVLDLIMIGVGAIIGTGIFVITGVIAAKFTGPAIIVSFSLAGIVSIFTALAYAELAAAVPASGGAYTYSYIVFGEFIAWVVACCILMVMILGSAAVAAGWAGYIIGVLKSMQIELPQAFTAIPTEGGVVNLLAVSITCIIGLILIKGTKESALLNNILVFVKVGIILLFVLIALPYFNVEFITGDFAPFGFGGVAVGAATLFIAYAGFDTVAMAAEECKNPNRDLPIGIIGSLAICALLYIIVSGVLTGIAPYPDLDTTEPMAFALRFNGNHIGGTLVAVGAIAGMTTVLMMQMFGVSRVMFSMARDGLIPKSFMKLHSKFETPYVGILFATLLISVIAGFAPIAVIANLSSLSIITSFIVVLCAVLVLRIRDPGMRRPFKCPVVFVIAPIALISCLYLLVQLLVENGKQFGICLFIGAIFYFLYGYRNSSLNKVAETK